MEKKDVYVEKGWGGGRVGEHVINGGFGEKITRVRQEKIKYGYEEDKIYTNLN